MVRHAPAPLPLWEQTMCWVVGVGGLLYAVYRLYITSVVEEFNLHFIDQETKTLGRSKDTADYEWHVYSSHLCWRLPPVLLLHVIVSQTLAHLNLDYTVRRWAYTVTGVLGAWWLVSWRFPLLLGLCPLPFHLASTLGPVPAVWGVALTLTLGCSLWVQSLMDVMNISNNADYFVVVYVVASVLLRCTCFSIDRIWALHKVKLKTDAREDVNNVMKKPDQPHPCTDKIRLSSDKRLRNGSKDTKPVSQSTSQSHKVKCANLKTNWPCEGQCCSEACLDKTSKSQQQQQSKSCVLTQRLPSASSVYDKKESSRRKCPFASSAGEMCGRADEDDDRLYGWPMLSEVPGLIDFYLYVFYIPSLCSGPPLQYHAFLRQVQNPSPLSRDQVASIAWRGARIGFWFCFNNVMLHFLYFSALGHDPEAVLRADRWTVGVTVWLVSLFMTTKYTVIYGAMTLLATLDGVRLPDNPVCVAYVYACPDLWRSFDRGLYGCLKRYIHTPVAVYCRGRGGYGRHVGTALTFLAMGLWHGADCRHLLWSALNVVNICLHRVVTAVDGTSPLLPASVVQRLTIAGVRRAEGLLNLPTLWLAHASSMVFLVGPHLAIAFVLRMCLQWDSLLILGLISYCMIQNSKHLQRLGYTRFS